MNENINHDFYKIIAIRFDGLILFGNKAIEMLAIRNGQYDQILSIAEFKLLSKLDLGDKWGKYAELAPILFEIPIGTTPQQRNPNPFNHRLC